VWYKIHFKAKDEIGCNVLTCTFKLFCPTVNWREGGGDFLRCEWECAPGTPPPSAGPFLSCSRCVSYARCFWSIFQLYPPFSHSLLTYLCNYYNTPFKNFSLQGKEVTSEIEHKYLWDVEPRRPTWEGDPRVASTCRSGLLYFDVCIFFSSFYHPSVFF
jgi:hypothetical protein